MKSLNWWFPFFLTSRGYLRSNEFLFLCLRSECDVLSVWSCTPCFITSPPVYRRKEVCTIILRTSDHRWSESTVTYWNLGKKSWKASYIGLCGSNNFKSLKVTYNVVWRPRYCFINLLLDAIANPEIILEGHSFLDSDRSRAYEQMKITSKLWHMNQYITSACVKFHPNVEGPPDVKLEEHPSMKPFQ